jgi:hypothetical protein
MPARQANSVLKPAYLEAAVLAGLLALKVAES